MIHRTPGRRSRRRDRGIVTALVLALVLAACAGTDAADETTTTTAAQATTIAPADTTTTTAPETTTTAAPEDTTVLQPLEDGFPDRRITLWNAFEPGHTDDLFNVIVADIARKYSPVPLITDSHPSGSRLQYGLVEFLRGQAGAEDGYHPYAISYFGGSLRPYTVDALADADLTDIQPINSMVQAPFVFVAPLNSPFESLEDVATFARENPGELTAVGSGSGSGLHSTLLVWGAQEGVDFRFIPTDGAGESRNTLAGEGAMFGCVTFQPGMDETLKILAVTGPDRVSTWPDVPATGELGLNIPAGSFRGLGTLPGIPAEHLDWLDQLFQRVFADPAFAEEMPGFELTYHGPEETAALRQDIVDTFIPVLEDAGFTIER